MISRCCIFAASFLLFYMYHQNLLMTPRVHISLEEDFLMYILETEQSFDSAHFLSGYKGKCSNLHGHRWRVVARIAMDELNKEGQTRDMVIDFGDFKDALKKLTDALDHSFIFETGSLKETTVIALKEEGFLLHEVPFRPTAEQFSRYFYEQLQDLDFPVYNISVYETPTNCSTYQEASL